jgi:hypothetical protein
VSASLRVEVFLDGLSCGGPVWVGSGQQGKEGWVKVGGQVVVRDVSADNGVGHTIAVTVQGYGAESGEGWSVAIDDVGVIPAC